MSGHAKPMQLGTCRGCGKQSYEGRKPARAAAHRLYPHAHMSAYPCPHPDGRGWHIGHLPKVVVTGQIDRSHLVPRRAAS